MTRLLTWLLTTALALAAATGLLDGLRFTGPRSGTAELESKVLPLLGVALILGVVSALVKPVLTLLSFPLILLTLGLFLLVINALVLLLTGWLADRLGLGFRVDGFWSAVGGAVVVTVVTWLLDAVLDREERA